MARGRSVIQVGEGVTLSPPSFLGPDVRFKADCMLREIMLSLQTVIHSYRGQSNS